MHWKIPSGKRWLFELQSYLSYKSLRLCNGLSPGIRADTATFESTLRQTLQMEPHHVTGNSFFQVLMVSFDAGYCGGVVAGRDQHLLPCSQFTILNTAHGDSPNIWNTMLTSSHGNIFRVTGPLCGEFTGPVNSPHKGPVTRSFEFFIWTLTNDRANNRDAGDLRRHRAHYDVIVMLVASWHAWKRFPHYWLFLGEPTANRRIPLIKGQ